MAGLSLSGGKNKSKQSQQVAQTTSNTLSDRAAGMLTGGINSLQGKTYHAYDPASAQQYMDPYQGQVIDASLAQADHADAIARAQQQSDIAGRGAFGDARRGIYEAELQGNQSRDRASLIAGLNSANYGQAQQAAMGQNDNANQYDIAIQQLINQLRGGFTNEGTQAMNGTSSGKSKGYNLGFGWGAQ